ncbi:MAG: CDP-glycerol glycerophosphotransferase family protein [Paludibacteraceae bacterium]|nr:CDP-glycerol glycerophosphotransferase family protein [Paludibacteraceae bacterium]
MKRLNLAHIKNRIIYLLSAIIPKGKMIVLNSSPDYSDNPYALYKYLLSHPVFKDYRYVWFLANANNEPLLARMLQDNPSVIIPRRRLAQWWYLLRATFLIYSHSFYDDFDFYNKKKRINLWHGTGFKKSGIDNGEKPVKSDYLLTTNRTWQRYLAHSFVLPEDHVLPLGEPRTDLMFQPTDFFEQWGIDRTQYASVGIWLPTFRKHILLDTTEGAYNESMIAGFTMEQLGELDTFLRTIKGLLIIKLHMYDKLQEVEFPSFTNLLIVKPKAFTSRLYSLLGATDYLITDYSSVSFDYDILNRPMAFVINDIKQYTDYRGFYGEDIENQLPGPIINSIDELEAFIAHPEQYKVETGNRFNDHKDAKVCSRVAEELLRLV